MKKCLAIFLLLLALLTASVCAQTQPDDSKNIGSGIIYGRYHSYMLTAPKGWVMDNQSGVSQELYAVFYPKGSSWAKGSVVMYTNVLAKTNEEQSLQGVISEDIQRFKQTSPDLKVGEGGTLPLKHEKSAVVKTFSNDAYGSYESVAYINESKVVVIVVLTARSKKDHDASLPAFRELVASYFFITDKVTIEK